MEANDVTGRRIGAAIIDLGIMVVLLLLVGALFGNDAGEDASVSQQLGPLDSLLFLALAFRYYWGTELSSGQTLGKRVLAIRVVAVGGGPASGRAILVRNARAVRRRAATPAVRRRRDLDVRHRRAASAPW